MPTWIAGTSEAETEKRRNGETKKREVAFLLFSDSPILPISDSSTSPARNQQLAILSAGFTLLELAVVLFIVGLLMTIAIPHLGNTSNARLEATARRLAATVRYLSGEAALRNRPYRLNYDLDQHTYWITTLVTTQDHAEFRNDLSPLSRPVQLPPSITFADIQTSGVGRISTGRLSTHFQPQGYADPTIIHLRNQQSRTITVLIPALTGEARIYEGYVEGFGLGVRG
jgi:general secretion pathway protein H